MQLHLADGSRLTQQAVEHIGDGSYLPGCRVIKRKELRGRKAVVPGEKLGGDFPVAADVKRADMGKLGAAGGADNVLSLFVLHDDLVDIVGVAVKPGVDAAAMGNHVAVHPGAAFLVVSHVSDDDHIIRAGSTGSVNRLLYRVVDRFAGLVGHKAVDKIAVFILEIARDGGADRDRGGNAHKADLHAADLLDDPRLKNQLALLIEIAADVGETRFFRQGKELLHAVVKFVVAGDSRIVAHGVHDVNDGLAPAQKADGFALYGVAVIHQEHVIILGKLFLDGVETGKAPALVDAAVDIACKKDNQIPLLRGRLG